MATDESDPIRDSMRKMSTDDLHAIWVDNNQNNWTEQAINAAKLELLHRREELRPQNSPVELEEPDAEILDTAHPGYMWLVRDLDGAIHRYQTEQEIKDAVVNGDIRPEMQAKKITDESKESESEHDWNPVEDEVAKYSFDLRVLFQPIWAHSVSGARIGARLGIGLWVGSLLVGLLLAQNYFAGGVIAVSFFLWLAEWFPIRPGQHLSRTGITAVVLAMLFGASRVIPQVGFGPVLGDVAAGCQMLIGAWIGGALAGVFPGMAVGTVVGIVRRSGLPVSPHAVAEGPALLLKGLLVPVACFALLAFLHMEYFLPWMNQLLSK